MSSDKEDVISQLQAIIRGRFARKNYQITQLQMSELIEYKAFLTGNDPCLTRKQLSPYLIERNFLLVGTSVFRSIDLACKLAASEAVFPKVIIIDNSSDVHLTWLKLKKFFAESPSIDAREFVEDPEQGLLEFILTELFEVTRNDNGSKETNPFHYFKNFFKEHSLEYVKRVVAATVIIKQDWGHTLTFEKIRKIYADRPIVAYPSNIIHFVSPAEQIRIIENLATLQPMVSICTDLHPVKKAPSKTYLFESNQPHEIARDLELSADVQLKLTAKASTSSSENGKNLGAI